MRYYHLKARETLCDLNIDGFYNKIIFVPDGGGNIRKALRETGRLNCFVHFLKQYACVGRAPILLGSYF